jgi:hypothetical protein
LAILAIFNASGHVAMAWPFTRIRKFFLKYIKQLKNKKKHFVFIKFHLFPIGVWDWVWQCREQSKVKAVKQTKIRNSTRQIITLRFSHLEASNSKHAKLPKHQ